MTLLTLGAKIDNLVVKESADDRLLLKRDLLLTMIWIVLACVSSLGCLGGLVYIISMLVAGARITVGAILLCAGGVVVFPLLAFSKTAQLNEAWCFTAAGVEKTRGRGTPQQPGVEKVVFQLDDASGGLQGCSTELLDGQGRAVLKVAIADCRNRQSAMCCRLASQIAAITGRPLERRGQLIEEKGPLSSLKPHRDLVQELSPGSSSQT